VTGQQSPSTNVPSMAALIAAFSKLIGSKALLTEEHSILDLGHRTDTYVFTIKPRNPKEHIPNGHGDGKLNGKSLVQVSLQLVYFDKEPTQPESLTL